jgi:hypothetical protein
MSQQFFYDGQVRRFITQFIRAVSGFQVEFGVGANGQKVIQQVPVIYGDPSRQAAVILKQNSENMMNSVPAIAVYVSGLDYDRDRLQDPSFTSTLNIRERAYDPVSGNYLDSPGDAYTVERLMPVPYKLSIKLDIWTSNTEQKLQLWEQISTLFNPSLELQSTDNFIDWGSLTAVELKSTVWDSRSIPANADESISIVTMQFEMPIWISSPAKVKRLGVITKVINSIYDANGDVSLDAIGAAVNGSSSANLMSRRATVFKDYYLIYTGNQLRLVNKNQLSMVFDGDFSKIDRWDDLIAGFGTLRNGVSEIRLRHPNGVSEVVGTVAPHPTDDSILLYSPNIDTLPANSVKAINAIIDPMTVNVDNMDLLTPSIGTRYLILNPIGSYNNSEAAIAWDVTKPNFVANRNDVIEYTSNGWTVSFDSANSQDYEFVTNLTTGVQYQWNYKDSEWVKSVEGLYEPNNWSMII